MHIDSWVNKFIVGRYQNRWHSISNLIGLYVSKTDGCRLSTVLRGYSMILQEKNAYWKYQGKIVTREVSHDAFNIQYSQFRLNGTPVSRDSRLLARQKQKNRNKCTNNVFFSLLNWDKIPLYWDHCRKTKKGENPKIYSKMSLKTRNDSTVKHKKSTFLLKFKKNYQIDQILSYMSYKRFGVCQNLWLCVWKEMKLFFEGKKWKQLILEI